jgi:hypothetical protein
MSDQANLDPTVYGVVASYLAHPPPNERPAQKVVAAIRDKIQSGDTDPADLQRRLTERFGAKADGIVAKDGTIDYARLETVVGAYRAELEDRVRHRLGENHRPPKQAETRESPVAELGPEPIDVPHVPKVDSVVPEPPKTPEPHGIRQFVDKILHELVGDDLDKGSVVNLKT